MNYRLISPQQLAKQSRDTKAGIKIRATNCQLTWDFHTKTVSYNEQSKLPILYTAASGTKIKEFYADLMINSSMKTKINKSSSDITITTNICKNKVCFKCIKAKPDDCLVTFPDSNVSKATHDLQTWHECLGHMQFDSIQSLARSGYLPKHIANCDKPVCASCQFGKAHK